MTFIYNCTRHRSTGYSPYYLMFGRNPRTPLENILQLQDESPEMNIKEFIADHCQHLEQAYALADQKINKEKHIRKGYYDRRARELPLTEGCLVYVKDHPKGRCKIQDRYKNTIYKIVRCYEDKNIYGITPADGSSNNIKVVNRSELIECPTVLSEDEKSESLIMDNLHDSSQDEGSSSDDSSTDDNCEYHLIERESHESEDGSDSEDKGNSTVEEDYESASSDSEPLQLQTVRRSSRTNKGLHSNPHNWPRSVNSP